MLDILVRLLPAIATNIKSLYYVFLFQLGKPIILSMDKIITIHKLCVDYNGFKFIQMVKSNTLLSRLLKKLEKSYFECFPKNHPAKFERVVEDGYIVPLMYTVGEVFGSKSLISVYGKEESERIVDAAPVDTETIDYIRHYIPKEIRSDLPKKKETEKEELRKEHIRNEDTKRDETRREESRKEEIKKDDARREEVSRDSKIDLPNKKKLRHERSKETPAVNKAAKVDEDKRIPIQNEAHKKDLLISSSSTDSDADIFVKDEKKPTFSKSNIFRG